MSKFKDRATNPIGHSLLSAIGFPIAGVFLIALGIAIIIVIIVPGVLAAGLAVRTERDCRVGSRRGNCLSLYLTESDRNLSTKIRLGNLRRGTMRQAPSGAQLCPLR